MRYFCKEIFTTVGWWGKWRLETNNNHQESNHNHLELLLLHNACFTLIIFNHLIGRRIMNKLLRRLRKRNLSGCNNRQGIFWGRSIKLKLSNKLCMRSLGTVWLTILKMHKRKSLKSTTHIVKHHKNSPFTNKNPQHSSNEQVSNYVQYEK